MAEMAALHIRVYADLTMKEVTVLTRLANWLGLHDSRVSTLSADDMDYLAQRYYDVADNALYGNGPEACYALELIGDAYADAAEILRKA